MESLPPSEKVGVLLIEEDAACAERLERMIKPGATFEVVGRADSMARALDLLDCNSVEIVLVDGEMACGGGMAGLGKLRARSPHLPVVVLAKEAREEVALQCVHRGAQEYLIKERLDLPLLERTLRYAIERARTEAALSRERELFTTLLDGIPDRVYFKDSESRFIRVNRAMADFFHLQSAEQTHGKTDANFFGPEHALEALHDERRVMETGEAIAGKVEREIRTDGSASWSLTSKLPLRDGGGRIIGTCGISREITQLKEMEERLVAERNLLRSVIDNLPDLIFLKDIEGRYLLVNAAFLEWVGAGEAAEVIGRTVREFFPNAVADQIEQAEQAVLHTGQALINQESQLVDSRGNSRWSLMTKMPWRREDGTVLGLVSISRDITEKKAADENLQLAYAELAGSREELLAAMKRLQAAHRELREMQVELIEAEKMKSVGRLAAGVAHEVKNPLAVLRMGIDYLASSCGGDENNAYILRQMEEAVVRADGVIRGLLDFSAPTRLEIHAASLNAVIEDAIRHVQTEFAGKFRMVRELQKNLPEVRIDSAKFAQAFVNLFTNAIHAMEADGVLTVRTYARQLTGIGPNVSNSSSGSFRVGQTIIVAEVEDSGPGIPEDKITKIFEPFFTTKPTGKGTGLGLSVVKTIVDLHGGAIDLRNLPHRGVRATITLPT